MKRLIGTIMLFVLIQSGGCQQSTSALLQVTPTRTPTQTLVPTEEPSLEPSSTSIPILDMQSLPAGEYLSVMVYLADERYQAVVSGRGEFQGYLAKLTDNNSLGVLSPDLRYLLDTPYLLDLNTEVRSRIDEISDCKGGSWSPDGKHIVLTCSTSDEASAQLFIFSLEDHSLLQVTTNTEPEVNYGSSWSPDGLWIAYRGDVMLGQITVPAYRGLHIMDTRCLPSPSTCWQDEPGIDLYGPYSWSPDSRFIAGTFSVAYNDPPITGELKQFNEVRVYRVVAGVPTLWRQYPVLPLEDQIWWISWSPDGKQIVMTTNTRRLLLSVEDGQISTLSMSIRGSYPQWFRVP